jgi:hypothetical protein
MQFFIILQFDNKKVIGVYQATNAIDALYQSEVNHGRIRQDQGVDRWYTINDKGDTEFLVIGNC